MNNLNDSLLRYEFYKEQVAQTQVYADLPSLAMAQQFARQAAFEASQIQLQIDEAKRRLDVYYTDSSSESDTD